jgi:hypothetical protein
MTTKILKVVWRELLGLCSVLLFALFVGAVFLGIAVLALLQIFGEILSILFKESK